MKVMTENDSFAVLQGEKTRLFHSKDKPMIYVGIGEENVKMYRGNFKIEDYITERIPLKYLTIIKKGDTYILNFEEMIEAKVTIKDDAITIGFECFNPKINRFWLRVPCDLDESFYGCGEQMSYFNLRGRQFPLWSSEPGVGRDKTSYMTFRCDVDSQSGGDYYNTNYPQPTYVSSDRYYLDIDSTAYGAFDFRQNDYVELQMWEVPKQIRIESAKSFPLLLEKITKYFGKQPLLPDWIYQGAILGLQGGTERAFSLAEKSLEMGIKVAGIWCQDWEGKKVTSFGKRLLWDWRWNEEMYPNLPEKMKEYDKKGIRILGYINPYLVKEGTLYQEGKKNGYFATKEDGSDYLVDFGEFDCGVVDFTNPDAYAWFKEIIKKNLIEFGLSGWMADFGEYLPTDLTLFNGNEPMIEHNHWPALWAKCNYDALVETGKLGEVVYFMRAGAKGTQKYCPLLWAGDQCVDFSIHDGLATVIVGALSSGMIGCGLHHSDIGGYTSLYENLRTKEVFLRWAEMAAFTPVMRTHEGNRPDTNFQYYDDEDAMKEFARLTNIHVMLTPYIKYIVSENTEKGIPAQRPLFIHYEEDTKAYQIQTEYLFGRDLLVAPVFLENKETWSVYLPEDEWVHLWSGDAFGQGEHEVLAPMGKIPVFYRKNSQYCNLFETIGKM